MDTTITATVISRIPTFPARIHLVSSEAKTTVTLNVDGTWDGDPDAVEGIARSMEGPLTGAADALIWLVLREMRRDQKDAETAAKLEAMTAKWDSA